MESQERDSIESQETESVETSHVRVGKMGRRECGNSQDRR